MIEHEEHRSPGICILNLQIMVLAAVLILGHACFETPVTFAKDSSSVSVETDAACVAEDSRDQSSEKHDDAAVRQQRRPEGNQAQLQKVEEPDQIKQHLSEEERLMQEVIQPLDRESGARWLAGFISSKPWNCPLRQKKDWIESILDAVERNHIPICKEILGLVATLISIESGFQADPLVVGHSGGEAWSLF